MKRYAHHFVLTNQQLKDINPLSIGEQTCAPRYTYGPCMLNHVLIHYVVRGCGRVYKEGICYEVHAGEAFLIFPDEVVTYMADDADPWYYQWVSFNGALSERFCTLPTVIPFPSDSIRKMLDLVEENQAEYRIAGLLFELYAALFGQKPAHRGYVNDVKDCIHALYMYPLQVEKIAAKLNLNRRYLSRIFREQTGKTVQEYLITVRMETAQRCLENGCSVEQAANLSGYEDVSGFSKLFKKRYGKSPLEWKKERLDKQKAILPQKEEP